MYFVFLKLKDTSTKLKKQKKSNDYQEEKKKKIISKQSSCEEEGAIGYIHVRARRGQATDSHSLAERVPFFYMFTPQFPIMPSSYFMHINI